MNKSEIIAHLEQHVAQKQISYAEVARQIDYSQATVSQARTGKWDNIADEFWQKLSAYLGYRSEWKLAEIDNYRTVIGTCRYAKEFSRAKAICYEPGSGKSASLKHFANQTTNTWYIECEEHWRGKDFARNLCKTIGIKDAEGTRTQLIEQVIDFLKGKQKPLLIIDEFDKLTDSDAQIFKSLYNKLEDICGFVICGAPFLKKRMQKGFNKDKQGYKEILSRLGGEFVALKRIKDTEIIAICHANGISDANIINLIIKEYNDTVGYDAQAKKRLRDDLRNLKEIIVKHLTGKKS